MTRYPLFLGIVSTAIMSGCATWGQEHWQVVPEFQPAIGYTWTKTASASKTAELCGGKHSARPGVTILACMHLNLLTRHCDIFSHMDEGYAKSFVPHGTMSTWEHEMKHCGLLDGKVWKHD